MPHFQQSRFSGRSPWRFVCGRSIYRRGVHKTARLDRPWTAMHRSSRVSARNCPGPEARQFQPRHKGIGY
jgi:hypothetical protein